MLHLTPLRFSSTNHLLIAYWVRGIKTYNCWYRNIDNIHWMVQFSCSVVFDSLRPHGLQHTRLPCPSPTPEVGDAIQPSHPLLSPSPPAFKDPASGSFPVSQFFASGGQSTGVSASTPALPMNIQNWFSLGWTGWISLQSKWLSRVFSNTTV